MIHQLHKTWKGRLQLFCCLPYEEKMCLNWRKMIVRSSIRHCCWDNKLHVQHGGSQTCITPSVVSNGVDVEVHRWLWLIALWFLHQSFLFLFFVFLKEAVITCKKTTACVEGLTAPSCMTAVLGARSSHSLTLRPVVHKTALNILLQSGCNLIMSPGEAVSVWQRVDEFFLFSSKT